MTRERYKKAKEIISVLDRIDRVLTTTTIIHNGETTFKHAFKYDADKIDVDICLLAQNDVKDGFLKLLYDKKLEMENELKQL